MMGETVLILLWLLAWCAIALAAWRLGLWVIWRVTETLGRAWRGEA